MKTIAIHQPEYLPWLGFFKKMSQCDELVIFDDVQFENKGFQNRNYIRTNSGSILLTVPVKVNSNTLIKDVKIDNTKHWRKKHMKSILLSYSKAKYFHEYESDIKKIYEEEYETLVGLNMKIIEYIKKQLGIKARLTLSSSLNIDGETSDRILEICKKLGAEKYISGTNWALEHLNQQKFNDENIKIQFQEFVHPKYNQCHSPFIEKMSTIDLIFNEGKNAINILNQAETTLE